MIASNQVERWKRPKDKHGSMVTRINQLRRCARSADIKSRRPSTIETRAPKISFRFVCRTVISSRSSLVDGPEFAEISLRHTFLVTKIEMKRIDTEKQCPQKDHALIRTDALACLLISIKLISLALS